MREGGRVKWAGRYCRPQASRSERLGRRRAAARRACAVLARQVVAGERAATAPDGSGAARRPQAVKRLHRWSSSADLSRRTSPRLRGQFLQPLQHPLAEAARHFLGHDVAELAQQRRDLLERDDVGPRRA